MVRPAIEVVHVGSASRDLTPDDPRGWRLGGGVTYAALTTARLGLRTAAVIGVDEAAADADELDLLRDAGRRPPARPARRGARLREPRDAGRARPDLSRGRAGRSGRPVVPASWLERAGLVARPGRRRGRRRAGRRSSRPAAYVALGWQGMLRELVPGRQVDATRARRRPRCSRRADLVGVSHHDVAAGTSLADLAAFLHPGPTCSSPRAPRAAAASGSAPTGRTGTVRYRPTATDRETDPTGAGDTFLAALLASVLRPAIVGRARARRSPDLRFAAAAGSLVVEDVGLAGVPDRAAVLVRRARERSAWRSARARTRRSGRSNSG